jgi:hypothetical protein
MNLIETLNKLRQDIQTWVGNNIRALDSRKSNIDHSHDYNDLSNTPNIQDDGSDRYVITDKSGNVIASFDANGLTTTGLHVDGQNVTDTYILNVDSSIFDFDTSELISAK